MSKKYTSEDWLRCKFIDENLNQSKIADICDVSDSVIGYHLNKNNLKEIKGDDCYSCGKSFISLTHHWNNSPCSHPELSRKQKDVITGLLMSDGNIQSQGNRKPTFRCSMKESSRPYLEYLDEEVFPLIGLGVDEASMEGVVRFYTIAHPGLTEFLQWYSSGNKKWPLEELEINPTIFKHLYVGDGTYNTTESHEYIAIGMANEYSRSEEIKKLFENIGFYPSLHKHEKDGKRYMNCQFNKKDTEKIFNWMGEPLPGFEYKWPEYC